MGHVRVRARRIIPQPFKHPKSGVYYFRKVIPERLRAAMGGRREIRQRQVASDVEQCIQAELRTGTKGMRKIASELGVGVSVVQRVKAGMTDPKDAGSVLREPT